MDGVDVRRYHSADQICGSENPDQVGDGVGRNSRASVTEHLREAVDRILFDLDAWLGTLIFREFIGSPDSLWVVSGPFHPFWPLIVITSEAVQVKLVLLEFCAVSGGRWSSVLRTFGSFWRWRLFGTV